MNKLSLILPVVLSFACSPPITNTYSVYIDPDWGDQTPMVVQSFQDWQTNVRSSGGDLTLNIILEKVVCDAHCKDAITIHPSDLATIGRIANAPNTAFNTTLIGITYRDENLNLLTNGQAWSNIYIALDIPAGIDYQVVIEHEIGHALMLNHVPENGALMNADYNNAAHWITCDDIRQFGSLHHQSIFCDDGRFDGVYVGAETNKEESVAGRTIEQKLGW